MLERGLFFIQPLSTRGKYSSHLSVFITLTNTDLGIEGGTQGVLAPFFTSFYVMCPIAAYRAAIYACESVLWRCVSPLLFECFLHRWWLTSTSFKAQFYSFLLPECFLWRKKTTIGNIRVRGGAGGCSPPKLGRNPFYLSKFSERTIGNSGSNFTAPLNLTSSYAHD